MQSTQGLAKADKAARNPDSLVRPTDHDGNADDSFSAGEVWPAATGVDKLWFKPSTPTIAIVDSGIQSQRSDFDYRVVARVNLATLQPNSPGDGRGHGTLVAGLAAGAARGMTGGAPRSRIWADVTWADVTWADVTWSDVFSDGD